MKTKDKPLKKELIEKQVFFIEKIQRIADVNLVNCGHCDSILFHDTNDEQITCPYCEFTSDPCDFPDYIYDGMINNFCYAEEKNIECNDIDGTTLYVSDKVVVLDTEDLDGDVPAKGQVLTVSKLVDAESNYIEFDQGRYAFFGHRVLRLK